MRGRGRKETMFVSFVDKAEGGDGFRIGFLKNIFHTKFFSPFQAVYKH